jgi:hypothetical protein
MCKVLLNNQEILLLGQSTFLQRYYNTERRYPYNRPLRPIRLWDFKALTFSRQREKNETIGMRKIKCINYNLHQLRPKYIKYNTSEWLTHQYYLHNRSYLYTVSPNIHFSYTAILQAHLRNRKFSLIMYVDRHAIQFILRVWIVRES